MLPAFPKVPKGSSLAVLRTPPNIPTLLAPQDLHPFQHQPAPSNLHHSSQGRLRKRKRKKKERERGLCYIETLPRTRSAPTAGHERPAKLASRSLKLVVSGEGSSAGTAERRSPFFLLRPDLAQPRSTCSCADRHPSHPRRICTPTYQIGYISPHSRPLLLSGAKFPSRLGVLTADLR